MEETIYLPGRNHHLKSWESSNETSWKHVESQKIDVVIPKTVNTSESPQNLLVLCVWLPGKSPLRVSK